MRVFSQINNWQQKKKSKNKQTNKTKQKRGGVPLLDLAKSIYYLITRVLNDRRSNPLDQD